MDEKLFQLLDQTFDELFPIMRSITGPGLERSLDIFGQHMPLIVEKVPTGEAVFDWEVPQEWHFQSAKLIGPAGEVICDTKNHTLHVVNYSCPIHESMSLEALQPHLHSLPNAPDAIPYVTSYYKPNWGFCLSHHARQQLRPGTYRVEIEASFEDGGVPFAQTVLPGESDQEILLSSYLCHPSMANNELSGPLVLLALHQKIKSWEKRRFSYRFLLNPETIGALCFLSRYNPHLQKHMVAGAVLTCLGGRATPLRYLRSRAQHSNFDKLASYLGAANKSLWPFLVSDFDPRKGSDERQYCSPGINLPMGQFSRTVYGSNVEYHTSADNKAFMDIAQVVDSAEKIETFLRLAEMAGKPVNLSPMGEPQLGRRGLYPNVNSAQTWRMSNDDTTDSRALLNRILILLNRADGETEMCAIARECECHLTDLVPIIQRLESEGLLSMTEKALPI